MQSQQYFPSGALIVPERISIGFCIAFTYEKPIENLYETYTRAV